MLEGGHKAGQAAGLFIFKSCRGSEIRSAIETKMQAIRDARESTSSRHIWSSINNNVYITLYSAVVTVSRYDDAGKRNSLKQF